MSVFGVAQFIMRVMMKSRTINFCHFEMSEAIEESGNFGKCIQYYFYKKYFIWFLYIFQIPQIITSFGMTENKKRKIETKKERPFFRF